MVQERVCKIVCPRSAITIDQDIKDTVIFMIEIQSDSERRRCSLDARVIYDRDCLTWET